MNNQVHGIEGHIDEALAIYKVVMNETRAIIRRRMSCLIPPSVSIGQAVPGRAISKVESRDRIHTPPLRVMDARGLRFYLPGILCVHLSRHENDSLEHIFRAMQPKRQRKPLIALLSWEQCEAITRCLVFLAAENRAANPS